MFLKVKLVERMNKIEFKRRTDEITIEMEGENRFIGSKNL